MADQINKFLSGRGGLGANLAAIHEAVVKITGHRLKPNQFKISGRKVFFNNCPPPLHSEILLKKAAILGELDRELGPLAPRELI